MSEERGGVLFAVRTDDRDFREVLPGLAYQEHEGAYTRRFPAGGEDIDAIFHNFTAHIETVLLQLTRHVATPWQEALAKLCDRLDRAGVEWFITGSAALSVRGVEVEPRDIDVVVRDHAAAAAALCDVLIEPPMASPRGAWIAGWFGRAFLGARVEWIADVDPDVDRGGAVNEIGPKAAGRLERVRWEDRDLWASPLDVQLAVNEHRGLIDRVRAIQRFTGDADAAR